MGRKIDDSKRQKILELKDNYSASEIVEMIGGICKATVCNIIKGRKQKVNDDMRFHMDYLKAREQKQLPSNDYFNVYNHENWMA